MEDSLVYRVPPSRVPCPEHSPPIQSRLHDIVNPILSKTTPSFVRVLDLPNVTVSK